MIYHVTAMGRRSRVQNDVTTSHEFLLQCIENIATVFAMIGFVFYFVSA